jgi:hypothetical protein
MCNLTKNNMRIAVHNLHQCGHTLSNDLLFYQLLYSQSYIFLAHNFDTQLLIHQLFHDIDILILKSIKQIMEKLFFCFILLVHYEPT